MARPSYKKRFGQHHLRNPQSCAPLLRFLRPEGELVVEIGPGGGVLTGELARAGARVWALEVDPEWALHLGRRARSEHWTDVSVVALDAQRFPWRALERPVLAAGNLPFNVGTPIIDDWLDHAVRAPERLPRAGFMVQKEVAERLTAGPGDEAYGGLSVTVAARARARLLGTVSPKAFRPPPKVAGAFVGFTPRQPPLPLERLPSLFGVVRAAFAARRKTLRNTLSAAFGRDAALAALETVGLDPTRRAETVDLDGFVALEAALVSLGGRLGLDPAEVRAHGAARAKRGRGRRNPA